MMKDQLSVNTALDLILTDSWMKKVSLSILLPEVRRSTFNDTIYIPEHSIKTEMLMYVEREFEIISYCHLRWSKD